MCLEGSAPTAWQPRPDRAVAAAKTNAPPPPQPPKPQWLAPGEIEPHRGGQARLDFVDSGIVIDSEVTAYVAPRLLEYSWSSPGQPQRPMRWTVSPLGGASSRLTLSLFIPDHEDVARSCAGFEAHLDMLAAALEDVPIKFPFERFKSAREAYGRRLAND